MSRWFRLYSDMLDDPKCQSLGAQTFKAWINLLCIASKNCGEIDEATVPFQLRMKPSEAHRHIAKLKAVGLMDVVENTLKPHNWESLQWVSDDSKERVRRHREKQKKKHQGNGHDNGDVTVTVTAPEGTEGNRENPLPNGKGLEAPILEVPVIESPELKLYRRGKEVLGKNSGGIIKNLLAATNGSVPQARAALETASEKHDCREYIGGVIRNRTRESCGAADDRIS